MAPLARIIKKKTSSVCEIHLLLNLRNLEEDEEEDPVARERYAWNVFIAKATKGLEKFT